jgi:hypothetical protein
MKGPGGVRRGGRRRPTLSQIERARRQTLSGWKEDDEEVDALILDSPKAYVLKTLGQSLAGIRRSREDILADSL